MKTHPFVSTLGDGHCSSCGKLRWYTVHNWRAEAEKERKLVMKRQVVKELGK